MWYKCVQSQSYEILCPFYNFRFDYNQMFGGKISKDVDYTETLDLRHFMSHKEVSGGGGGS